MIVGKFTDVPGWKELVRYDVHQAATDFSRLPPKKAQEVVDKVGFPFMIEFVSSLGSDAGAMALRILPEEYQQQIISELPSEKAGYLREILSYPPGTAASLMAKEYLSIPLEVNIQQAIEYLHSIPHEKKGKISYIYVVDKNARLRGVIQVRDLIIYPATKPVKDILKSPVVQVEDMMSQLDVAKLLQRHHYFGLPVVNAMQKLIGVISVDNALQVFEDEADDDITKIVGTSIEEIKTRSVSRILRLRLPWLFVNILSGLLCAWILSLFQRDIRTVATLFLFVPVVLGLSESAAIQGATIVVRNIALGHVNIKDLSELFFKEVLVGILIGAACGIVVGSVAVLWHTGNLVGIALAVSMALTISISALIGLTLPIVFKHLKIDPAMASGPLILAVCDILTLLIYFSLAGIILK